MSDHAYEQVELAGSSPSRTDDANRKAIETEARTLRHNQWFEVTKTRGQIVQDNGAYIQVTSNAGFHIGD